MGGNRKRMIVTEDLTKVYGDGVMVRALSGVNLEVACGEFLIVTGPSGSGKTTLLNLIGTLDEPTAGRVWVDGMEVSTLRGNLLADFRREHIGFIFQLFNLVPVFSALENVMLPLIPYRRQCAFDLRARAHELLEVVGLEKRAHHLPAQLSGGEQQRVAIARALVNEPDIVLADEPTGNLDSRTSKDIMDLFTDLNREYGRTIIQVTHEAEMASYGKRVITFRDGMVLKDERTERP